MALVKELFVALLVSVAILEKNDASLLSFIQTSVLKMLTADCIALSKALGMDYNQILNTFKPNMNALALYHYTKGGTRKKYKFTEVGSMINAAGYRKALPAVVVIHGWGDDLNSEMTTLLTGALLEQGGVNVLALATGNILSIVYFSAATNVRFIGAALGNVLVDMKKEGALDIHLIGHSLGAMISGFAGKTYQNIMGENIRRISGLDPAGPCFIEQSSDLKLSKTDADFVDTISSDGGSLGLLVPDGKAVFYPNNGRDQPGCMELICNHHFAFRVYAESIASPDGFIAVKCPDFDTFTKGGCVDNERAIMGYFAPFNATGTYYLKTRAHSPRGLGENGIGKIVPVEKNFLKRAFNWLINIE